VQEGKIARALLRDMDLEHKADSMIQQLSGGQRQRVAIARALACQPQLILADEPTASLDALTGRRIMELLRSISKERGVAILMTSHDQRLYPYADKVIRIDDGRIS
jgi:putative ABC transport system ATP-binding protein